MATVQTQIRIEEDVKNRQWNYLINLGLICPARLICF